MKVKSPPMPNTDAALAYVRSIPRTITAYSEADVAVAYLHGKKQADKYLTSLLKYAIEHSSARVLFPDSFVEDARAAIAKATGDQP